MSDKSSSNDAYWKANVRIIAICLIIWAFVSFGLGIVFPSADLLDSHRGHRSRILVRAAGFHPDLHRADLLLHLVHEPARSRSTTWTSSEGATMDQFTLNLLVVGASFALYVGIAIWARGRLDGGFLRCQPRRQPDRQWCGHRRRLDVGGFVHFDGGPDRLRRLRQFELPDGLDRRLRAARPCCFAPYLRKFGRFTVPEFIGDRFYSQTARIVAVICLLVISITYVIGQMTGAGVAFSRFLEVESWQGLLIALGRRLHLCRARRHEGHHLYAAGAILRADHGLYHPRRVHLPAAHQQPDPAAGPVPRPMRKSGVPAADKAQRSPAGTRLPGSIYRPAWLDPFNMFLFTMSLDGRYGGGSAARDHPASSTVPRVADARKSAGWALIFIALLYSQRCRLSARWRA